MGALTVLPASGDAERGLLGVIINQNDSLFQIRGDLVASDFIEPMHGELWLLLRDLIESGRPVTASTLVHDAQDAVVWGEIRASEYIQRLDRDAPPAHVVAGLAQTVRELSRRRRLISLAEEVRRIAIEAPASVTADEMRSDVDTALSAIFTDTRDLGLRRLAEVSDGVLERLKQKDFAIGLPPPLNALKQLLGPLMPGRIYMLGGSPGSGKSALLLQVARHVARQGKTALMYSIEMGDEEQSERALAQATGLSASMFERGIRDDADFERAWQANEAERDTKLFLDGSSSPTMAQIRGRAVRLKKLEGLDLLAVDHVHYIARTERKAGDFEALDENLKQLKQLAKDLAIPIVLICQFGTEALRDMARWPHRRPNQGDLLYSGIIDRHADVVALLHRREYWLRRNEPAKSDALRPQWTDALTNEAGWAELILTKRRGGRGWGSHRLGFAPATLTFSDNVDSRGAEPVQSDNPQLGIWESLN